MLTLHRLCARYESRAQHNKAQEKLCVFVIELKAAAVINVFKLRLGPV